ncbi:MAG: carbohydrate kinase [Litoreibacter sp.]
MTILCCGEALIDMLPRETSAGDAAFAPHAGGAVFNTSIALGRLGIDVGFFAGLSDDLFGAILRGGLTASKVSSDLCPIVDAPTTLAFVTLVNGQAQYAFYDENTALRGLSASDLPDLTGIDAMFFGGISLVYGDCADTYETQMLDAASSCVTMIDPNIRPSFIRDEISYRTRLERMIAAADIVKLSDEDLHWLEGDGDLADLAQGIVAKGPKAVLITEGVKGATAFRDGDPVFVPATPAQVVDTVGAGDTFNAGFLAGLAQDGLLTKAAVADLSTEALETALGLGIKTAAITVSRAGANPPWSHELE